MSPTAAPMAELMPLTAEHAPAAARLVESTIGGRRDPSELMRSGPGVQRRVLLDAGEPIGWLEYRCILDEAELMEIAVAPRARRRGHGRRLMQALLAALRASPARTLHLEVRASNRPARALYATFGLNEAGRRRRYYADGEDAILYCKQLEHSAPPGPEESP